MSPDIWPDFDQDVDMIDITSEFYQALIIRTKALRESAMSQAAMAKRLQIPVDTYKKYEQRTPLPLHLIPSFCAIVGCDQSYLISGEGESGLGSIRRKTRAAPGPVVSRVTN